ncbi:hypothetical protein M2D63_020295 [Pseudomonas sp. BJa5]|uniref:hypothetical protein n=1 Tax=Pseudomonas sp. BJa5 TaxID=2936270 RepID=UPI002559A362|nr:hypothetical protein [Pseudomonas sp. BGr12]MDL2423454.1 hypothetical protein [Pseudomonas sp. BGr12]
MKLTIKMSVVVAAAAAMMATAATAATQTEDASSLRLHTQSAQMLLAEDGSNRVLDYHQQNAMARSQLNQESGERYVQMIKEQPTASGVDSMQEALPPTEKSAPRLTDPITRDREEYRSAH